MTTRNTLLPVGLVAGLPAIVLFASPLSLSAQGDRDPSAAVQVQIAVTVVEYLETRYGTRESHPAGVAISGLGAQGPGGARVRFASEDASRVASLTDRPLVTDRWMCGANPSIRITWGVTIEEHSDREAFVEAEQASSTDQSHGSAFHRLRLERKSAGWVVSEVLSTFSIHGDCERGAGISPGW